jgi:hypothetical protein
MAYSQLDAPLQSLSMADGSLAALSQRARRYRGCPRAVIASLVAMVLVVTVSLCVALTRQRASATSSGIAATPPWTAEFGNARSSGQGTVNGPPTNATLLWTVSWDGVPTGQCSGNPSTVVADTECVYVINYTPPYQAGSTYMLALNGATGATQWNVSMPSGVPTSRNTLTMSPDGSLLAATVMDIYASWTVWRVACMRALDGELLWTASYTASNAPNSTQGSVTDVLWSPLGAQTSALFVALSNGTVLELEPLSGITRVLCSIPFGPRPLSPMLSATGDGALLFVNLVNMAVFAVNVSTGETEGRLPVFSIVTAAAPAAATPGALLITCTWTRVVALDVISREVVWSAETSASPVAIAVSTQGIAFVVETGFLEAFRMSDGGRVAAAPIPHKQSTNDHHLVLSADGMSLWWHIEEWAPPAPINHFMASAVFTMQQGEAALGVSTIAVREDQTYMGLGPLGNALLLSAGCDGIQAFA